MMTFIEMNTYRYPAYVVLEVPSPVCEAVQEIRDSLATPTSRLPVEITVAGSSGVGPVPAGMDQEDTERRLKSVLPAIKPFSACFQAIRRFPNTNIFYLATREREPFEQIHDVLKASGICFGVNPWPFNPHCSLRSGPMTDSFTAGDIYSLAIPKEAFMIDTLSIYEFDSKAVTCHLVFQTKLE